MKTILIAAFCWLACFCAAQTIQLKVTPTPSLTDRASLKTDYNSFIGDKAAIAETINISCGNGFVVISTGTGKVTFSGDCKPDEAAKTFWMAIERTYKPCNPASKPSKP